LAKGEDWRCFGSPVACAGCPPSGHSCLNHLHDTDISVLSNNIPQYYKDAIVACRSPLASKRASAQEVLEMFPDVLHSEIEQGTFTRADQPSLRDSTEVVSWTYCNLCYNRIEERLFNCSLCCAGDYDLCVKCFDAGLHCEEKNHFLGAFMLEQMERILTNDFYSSVRAGGEREILHF